MFRFLIDLFTKPRRHKDWAAFKDNHIKRNPTCRSCGGTKKLQVHHIVPYHVAPSRELDPGNVITLCRAKKYGVDCHLLVGHRGNWQKVNEYPWTMAKAINNMLNN